MSFYELFDRDDQGMVVPRVRLRLGGMTVRPGAHLAPGGLQLGDAAFVDLVGKSLEVEIDESGVHVIKGHY